MPRRFLVPVDFTPRSRIALRYAIRLARRWPAVVDVLHVVPPPAALHLAIDAWLGLKMPDAPEEPLAHAAERMALLLSSVDSTGVAVNARLEPGDPAATIVRVATEEAADLILLATHGRGALANLVIGSVAEKVMSCAPCPVLTLRGDEARPEVAPVEVP